MNNLGCRVRFKQRGAALIEAAYVMPLFFFLMMGIVEFTFVYRAKATFNAATFEAVRAGAMNNARLGPMKSALNSGMTPMYMGGKTGLAELVIAEGKAAIMGATIGNKTVQIVSPTKAMFAEFNVNLPVTLAGDRRERKRAVIPNDNLYWRTQSAKVDLVFNGATEKRKVSIQDANLLKINTFWCHKLVVPGLSWLVHQTILRSSANATQQRCNVVALAASAVSGVREYYIALESDAIIRMQTPVFFDSAENNLL
jgi:hypothetical protein